MGFTGEDSPLQGVKNLFITPRLGSSTREAKLRASWYVAHRMHEAITNVMTSIDGPSGYGLLPQSAPMDLELPDVQTADPWKQPELMLR